MSFIEDSLEEDANLRVISVQPRENDVDQEAWEYLRKTQADANVNTPRRMVTCSQTQATTESRLNGGVDHLDP